MSEEREVVTGEGGPGQGGFPEIFPPEGKGRDCPEAVTLASPSAFAFLIFFFIKVLVDIRQVSQ